MSRLRRAAAWLVPFVALALLAAACGQIASPQGWAAPVVTSEGILTSLHKGKLGLSDPTTGAEKWHFPPDSDKNTKLQGVYGTPFVAGSKVIFGAYDGSVYALNLADGKQLWAANTGASIVGNVVANGDTVFAGNSDGRLLALDIETGKASARWPRPVQTGDRIWSSPVLDGDTLYVTSMDKKVYAYRVSDGTQLWVNKDSAGAIASTPALSSGRLFVGSFDEHLYALDAAGGRRVWQSSPSAGNWFWSHSLVSGAMVYAGNLDGKVYAFDTESGAVRWTQKVGDSIRGRAVLSRGVLVVADRKGLVVGLNPDSGQRAWGPVDLKSTTLGDLVANDDGSVLIVTEGGSGGSRLVQIDPATGMATDLVKP